MNGCTETILGRFGKPLRRDLSSGLCMFLAMPLKPHSLQDQDGNILCCGKVNAYASRTPLRLRGYRSGSVFQVEHCDVPADTKENVARFLHYVSSDFSDAQAEAIFHEMTGQNKTPSDNDKLDPEAVAAVVHNNLFDFVKQPNCRELLIGALKRSSKKEQLADLIIKKVTSIHENETLFQELTAYEIPYDRIWTMLEHHVTKRKLLEYPYQYFSLYDIPILYADRYAKGECGLSDFSMQRLLGYVRAAVKYLVRCGNSCAPFERVIYETNRALAITAKAEKNTDLVQMPASLIYFCLTQMEDYCSVHTINGKSFVYMNHIWEEESMAVFHINRLCRDRKKISCRIDIQSIESELNIKYNAGQLNAFRMLETSGIKILTGPPGSGKTSIIRGLIEAFLNNQSGMVCLAATTGMAAKVMSTACGIEDEERSAKTLHKLLHILPGKDGTIQGRTLNDPIEADFIIVDETSMIDLQVFASLVSAVRNDTILLLVGDHDQLQSVNYGNVLNDLIESGVIETYRLTEILRQSGNAISLNAARINCGDPRIIRDLSFTVVECGTDTEARELLIEELRGKPFPSYAVLSPVRTRGCLSVAELNSALQEINPDLYKKNYAVYGKRRFYEGDKIVMTKNQYDKGYFNSNIGYIANISNGQILVIFCNGNGIRVLDYSDLHNMSLAYALTVHKSQGTECGTVYVVLPEDGAMMMTRRLLYTAVTRAKDKVIIYSVKQGYEKAVANQAEQKRDTLLKERLKKKLLA